MRIVCAPNAFKGALSAVDAAAAMAAGVAMAGPKCEAMLRPMADGGDGTMDVMIAAAGGGGRITVHRVHGPSGMTVEARLGWMDATTAVVEMAQASGLRLVGPRPSQPLAATSRGTGELIAAALDGGAHRIIVGVGGSATTDGGAGLLAALGIVPTIAGGGPAPWGGGGLAAVRSIDCSAKHPGLADCRVEVACDVHSPLLGPRGAAATFGPQKGATLNDVATLEVGMQNWVSVVAGCLLPGAGQLASRPMAGAAGGAAFGLAAIGATLVGGAALVANAIGLDGAIADAGLCITGEGRLDRSTEAGKAPAEVADRCRRAGVPCLALVGSWDGAVHPGFSAVRVLGDGLDLDDSIGRTAELLRAATTRAVHDWRADQ